MLQRFAALKKADLSAPLCATCYPQGLVLEEECAFFSGVL